MSQVSASGSRKEYAAFISYSHATDITTAVSLQRALQNLARPWYRLRALRIFRDETDLSASPEGWTAIESALDRSRFLILLASRNAAQSKWVSREVSYWLANRGHEQLLIALTDGDIVWNDAAGDFDWDSTSAISGDLSGSFAAEPLWVDLREQIQHDQLAPRQPEFQRSIARLAAPIHGVDVEQLVSEDRRQHRNTIRLASATVAILLALVMASLWLFQERRIADRQARDQSVLAAVARSLRVLYVNPLQAADEAKRALEIADRTQARDALKTAMVVARQRVANREEESHVLGAGVGYLMERWREGEVFSKLRADGRYALIATERGDSGPDPPGDVYLIGLDNQHATRLEPGKESRGRRLEYIGFSNAGWNVFVSRQFYLDIYDLSGTLTRSVQLEYHAKPTHLIAGMFGKYVLVGDTVGHLMLADITSADRPQLEGSRHGDAALFIDSNAAADRAIVIFESGQASLIDLADPTQPQEMRLDVDDVAFAVFNPNADSKQFLTTTRDGLLQIWYADRGGPRREAVLDHAGVTVGLASFSRDGARVISLDDSGIFRRWDIESAALLSSDQSEPTYDVVLADVGPKKLPVVQAVRSLTLLGLRDAKRRSRNRSHSHHHRGSRSRSRKCQDDLGASGCDGDPETQLIPITRKWSETYRVPASLLRHSGRTTESRISFGKALPFRCGVLFRWQMKRTSMSWKRELRVGINSVIGQKVNLLIFRVLTSTARISVVAI